MNEQQAQAMAVLNEAMAELSRVRAAKCGKYETRLAREAVSAAKRAAKKLGCAIPALPKKRKLSLVAGRLSRTFG